MDVNTKRGIITNIKDTDPNDPEDFGFTTTGGLGTYALDAYADLTRANTQTFANVVPGSYSVTEGAVTGFDSTALTCTSTGTGTSASGNVMTRTATIDRKSGG